MIRLKQILVATDFSEPSHAAMNYGRELARAFGAHLQILHAVDNLMATMVGPEGYIGNLMEMQRDVQEAARKQLEALINDEDRRELDAQLVLLTSSRPAFAIVNHAKEAGADLVVMGTHGRGGLEHLLMGSSRRSLPWQRYRHRHVETSCHLGGERWLLAISGAHAVGELRHDGRVS